MFNRLTLPAFVAILVLAGYALCTLVVAVHVMPAEQAAQFKDMSSAFRDMFLLIVGYFYGSSSGSAAKSATLEKLTGGTGDGTTTTKATIETKTDIQSKETP